MTPIEQIIAVLLSLENEDYQNARRYLAWMQLRRRVNNRFYFAAHWAKPQTKYHWLGR